MSLLPKEEIRRIADLFRDDLVARDVLAELDRGQIENNAELAADRRAAIERLIKAGCAEPGIVPYALDSISPTLCWIISSNGKKLLNFYRSEQEAVARENVRDDVRPDETAQWLQPR